MIALADVVRQYQGDLLQNYAAQLLPGHHRSLEAIAECRTVALGETLWACDHCAETARVPISCGHRNCPRCQNHEVTEWLDRQREKLLPVNYFLLTFTLPAHLRQLAWDHQRVVFDCLFKSVSATLKQFARNSPHLGGDAGMTLVLHTHNRRLDFHPHIHVVMPGGVIDRNASHWKALKGKYLFNEFALARVFRAKFLDALNKSALTLPAKVPVKWVAHCKHAGSGEPALTYLARYLYRGVISESSIISNKDGNVTFCYKDSNTKTIKTRTLSGVEFLWKVIRHVLPRGYQRARHFGFLHHNARVWLTRIQLLLTVSLKAKEHKMQKVRPKFDCPCCAIGTMRLIGLRRRGQLIRMAPRASPG